MLICCGTPPVPRVYAVVCESNREFAVVGSRQLGLKGVWCHRSRLRHTPEYMRHLRRML